MTTITTERSPVLLRATSMTGGSPRLSLKREISPPSAVDSQLLNHICDRLNQLDTTIHELRSSVLTKESYADRRNREDEFLRREFDNQRVRIDTVGGKTRSDLNQVKTDISQLVTEIVQLRSNFNQLSSKDGYRDSDLSRLHDHLDQLHLDVQRMHSELCLTRTDLSQEQSIVSQLRLDVLTLQREARQQFGDMISRFDVLDSRMKHMDRIRFNSLAITAHAPITPVPVIDVDGSIRFPSYFPRTVWNFWCLKKMNRAHRLVELAEFYQLEGYQYWSRMANPQESTFATDGYMSDDSDSSELPSDITRSEAARLYPEACHQALAATLGLVYYKIRNEMGEGRHSHLMPAHAAPKRTQEEVVSPQSSPRRRKVARRSQDIASPTGSALPHKIITNFMTAPAGDAKSIVSEGLDKLVWNVEQTQISEETMSKFSDFVRDEPNALLLLQALERGRIKLQPSHMERARVSPTETSSKRSFRSAKRGLHESGLGEAKSDDFASEMNTVPTEIMSPHSASRSEAEQEDEDEAPPSSSPPEAKE
ncbi:hypothetical protein H112_06415 [Trichophyton rubrum D6]|uniref:Uncharacterized protein n=4 Tax=Trichophyton TaxID=5550 RepID=A0A178F260_TRIRU|nr:uncharacterized protein TERG_01781 [Trichophyton rubrum CBS 118892]EZF13276.1 hypothetical protein H100_06429 [Trichophyton rubrum MR850]EZF39503.1 hypothetical protein H102_06395 [Trichophyton rubrum CBS 100081]EZF50332.1 hypothetical protein H103_06423 [Trichophyton rubrum CBS 288.86]EZF60961.1 hypothetical protein H104_06407 [Trichophyton rubrum CBS 289.86]EZF71478.1 hypothetical protein H105_06434 [Trichophyton soudanense CBS 452.61]EZF82289.1 hypothetical protein H110_06418 [Trichophy